MKNNIEVVYLGLQNYGEVLNTMRKQHKLISENENLPQVVYLVQHPAVVTVGNRTSEAHSEVLETRTSLQNLGIDYFEVERGGSVTVHEPGQIVMYPLLRCSPSELSVKKLVWCLEEAMILVCAAFNVVAARSEVNPGIWVGNNKIGALGLRVKNRVSFHGCALNVNNTLQTFSHIIPCGLKGFGVTSLQKESGVAEHLFKISEVEKLLLKSFLNLLES